MFGLNIGDIIRTTTKCNIILDLPITNFKKAEDGTYWASLGKISNGYGEREWLIAGPDNIPFWGESKWKLICL